MGWHSLRSLPFQGPKKSRFKGLPLPLALVMDIARIKIINRAIQTTGTLIVINQSAQLKLMFDHVSALLIFFPLSCKKYK
jgi:hypothetical protein